MLISRPGANTNTNAKGTSEGKFRIIDTAGIRKRAKVEYGAEFFMVNRAFKAIRRSDVVLLMLDATVGILDQDRILAEVSALASILMFCSMASGSNLQLNVCVV